MTESKTLQMSAEEYHADRKYLTRGALLDFRKSRRLFYGRWVTGEIPMPKQNEAMRIGQLVHTAVLEPEIWEEFYAIGPEKKLNWATKAGKEEKAEHKRIEAEAKECGIALVDPAEYRWIRDMCKAIDACDFARKLLESCPDKETTVTWKDEGSGLWLKTRRDFRRWGLVGDLKTTANPAPAQFAKSIANLLYYVQAALYSDGEESLTGEPTAFVFLVVGKDPPHEVAVYEMGTVGSHDQAELAIEVGRREYKQILRDIAKCHETDDWRNEWEKGPQMIDLPHWTGQESQWQ